MSVSEGRCRNAYPPDAMSLSKWRSPARRRCVNAKMNMMAKPLTVNVSEKGHDLRVALWALQGHFQQINRAWNTERQQ
jgi:hypothetical protein